MIFVIADPCDSRSLKRLDRTQSTTSEFSNTMDALPSIVIREINQCNVHFQLWYTAF